jgi:uncharacterized membrane protein YqhA
MRSIEKIFESLLWNSRFIVVIAVIGSVAAGFTMFFIATVDTYYLVEHVLHYASPEMTSAARKALHDDTITHIVEVVDGYLLGLVMMIFGLGMYELFVSDIDAAHGSKTSSKILVITDLDDLKNRLAKVILMILIVLLFERAIKIQLNSALDLLYLGGAIALVGLALYLSHAAEGHEPKPTEGSAEDNKH